MSANLLRVRKSIYGWIPDLPDQRDKLYRQLGVVTPEKLPKFVDSQASDFWTIRDME